MAAPRVERRLAAILAADVVGYSRLMERDEPGTIARLKAVRASLTDPLVAQHHGRIVKLMGDGALCEFASVVDAVACAVAIQRGMAEREAEVPEGERIRFRIGINLGDVVCDEDGDLHGDGVNIAVRLEGLADPGGVVVSGTAYDHLQGKLDCGLAPLGDRRLKNIGRPVRAYRVALGAGAPAAPPLPDKPSIAVLPFTNMSGDPEQEYFADGLVEDIITALSRVRSFFVIARNSSFTYKGRAVDVRQVSRELGVRYVLEGSIRKAGARVRIVGQLVDATTGHHVWADRFDGDMSDIFDLQDRVAESVVGAVEPSIRLEEIRQARTKPTNYITAYDLYLRALPGFYSMTSRRVRRGPPAHQRGPQHRPRFHLGQGARGLHPQHLRQPMLARARRHPRRDPHGARGARGGARRPNEPAVRRPGPGLQRQGLRDGTGCHRPVPLPQPQLRPGLHGRRLGERAFRPPAGRDRPLPQGHAPEPG